MCNRSHLRNFLTSIDTFSHRLNIEQAAARQARQRFTKYFGPLNQKVSIRNHTLVMLDAPGLAEEDYLRAAKYIDYDHWTAKPHGPVEFIRSLQGMLRMGAVLQVIKLLRLGSK